MKKHVSYISQLGNTDCGIACLTMLFNYYNLSIDIVDVEKECSITRDGTTLLTMKKIAGKFGFSFSAYRYEFCQDLLDKSLPSILYNGNHFVVVSHKISSNKYLIMDPAKGKIKYTFEEIAKNFTDIIVTLKPSFSGRRTVKYTKWNFIFNKGSFILIMILILLVQILSLMIPKFEQYIIDNLFSTTQDITNKYFLVFCIIIFSYFLINRLRQITLLKYDINFIKNIIHNMSKKIFKIDLNFYEWHSAGEIAARFNSVEGINNLFVTGLTQVIIQSITSAISLFIMFNYSFSLTVFIMLLALIELITLFFLNRFSRSETAQYILHQNKTQSLLVETLNNILEIRCMGSHSLIQKELDNDYNEQFASYKRKTSFSNMMECFISSFTLALPLIICLVGIDLITKQKWTVGALAAYIAFSNNFISPFTSIALLIPGINSIKEIILRYKELMTFRESNYGESTNRENNFNELIVDKATYSYNLASTKKAFENISFKVNKGDFLAIVGFSGSGKSTLLKAILGVIQIDSGRISINNTNIYEIPQSQIFEFFSVVTQNPTCFHDTIRKNIDISGRFTDPEIWEALECSELKKDVENMPLGLNTIIGEHGQNISGGQKQRLAIARAILSNPSCIILDEATSNLDPITEKKIFENLKKKNLTQIIVTHHLSVLQNATNILVMKDGKPVEYGNYETLIKNNNWYFQNFYSI